MVPQSLRFRLVRIETLGQRYRKTGAERKVSSKKGALQMFHDRKMNNATAVNTMAAAAFNLNADACRLMLLVEWYAARGERVLPVQYLKRGFFTRRQWELATKGARQRENGKLLGGSESVAPDGCQFAGIVSQHTELNEQGRPQTFWIIGQVDADALAMVRREVEDRAFSVVEDVPPKECEENEEEPVEPSVKVGTQTGDEIAYARGYRDGELHGYDKGVRDLEAVTGCRKATPITESFKGDPKRHAGKSGISFLFSKAELVDLVSAIREQWEAQAFASEPDQNSNQNERNLSELLAAERAGR